VLICRYANNISLKSSKLSSISSWSLPFNSPVIANLVMCPLNPVRVSLRSVHPLYFSSLFLLMCVRTGGSAVIMFMKAGQNCCIISAVAPVMSASIMGRTALIMVSRLMSVCICSRLAVIGSNCFI